TPYNKTYHDLSNQLRLFIPEDRELGLRPEHLIRDIGETEFIRRHQCPLRSLAAFEKSTHPDDWRELMRLYLVRRTRTFIQENYATTDPDNGRKYLTFEDGKRSYFPARLPKTVTFTLAENDPIDQYARLYSIAVVAAVNGLHLPRYGLGNYVAATPDKPPTPSEAGILQNLSRAGKRLMGFCRTNLFKRLESSGEAFLLSVERHILRNFIFLHAAEQGLPLPIGPQAADLLDARVQDEDADPTDRLDFGFSDDDGDEGVPEEVHLRTEEAFRRKAAEVYAEYAGEYRSRFRWLRPGLFTKSLAAHVLQDAQALLGVLKDCGEWDSARDAKLGALLELVRERYPADKVLVFSQFADTVRYLERELKARKVSQVAGATGQSADPTALAWRFSPDSNERRDWLRPGDELRVLLATDVLSEGQNLQDCHVVVNYDLPWAIIRLIQRAGRVDRIGQKASDILCFSFLPAEGVERIIRLRARVRQRLQENAEVVGTDEAFFEDDGNDQTLLDLYHEKSGVLDGDADSEVDLASQAYQIWKNAVDADPKLQKIIPELPDVVFTSRAHEPAPQRPEGVLVYLRTAEGNDSLAYIDKGGRSITESQFEILKAAECRPDTPAQPRHPRHHELVHDGVKHIVREEKRVGGQLGRPSGARFRTYERLKRYAAAEKGTLFESPELLKAIDEIYRYPLRQNAVDTLNRQLRAGIEDHKLVDLVLSLREEDRLCVVEEESEAQEPRIICSLGLFADSQEDEA
ncbi:MAG: SWF/SNF helicase family protein, partial [Deltaproteobacteria bacterium]|nr:SWF/SNF helicase family protein [Deltaproteobacteria bacterium]